MREALLRPPVASPLRLSRHRVVVGPAEACERPASPGEQLAAGPGLLLKDASTGEGYQPVRWKGKVLGIPLEELLGLGPVSRGL